MIHLAMTDLMTRRLTGENTSSWRDPTSPDQIRIPGRNNGRERPLMLMAFQVDQTIRRLPPVVLSRYRSCLRCGGLSGAVSLVYASWATTSSAAWTAFSSSQRTVTEYRSGTSGRPPTSGNAIPMIQ
jgi:hypothetical protein